MSDRPLNFIKKFGVFSAGGFFLTSPFSKGGAETFAGAVIFCALVIFFKEKRYRNVNFKDPFIIFSVIYIAWSFVSCLVGTDISRSFVIYRDEWVFAVIPSMAIVLDRKEQVLRAFRLLAISGTVIAIYAFVQHYWGYDLLRMEKLIPIETDKFRVAGLFNNSMTFGNYYIILGALLFPLTDIAQDKKYKILLGLASLLTIIAALLSYQRGVGWVFLWVLILFLIRYGKKHYKWLVPSVIVFAAALYLYAPGLINQHLSHLKMELSGTNPRSRYVIWKGTVSMITKRPIFGVGPGNFEKNFLPYVDKNYPYYHNHAHNDYLNIAVHTGIPSLLIFLGIYWAIFKKFRKIHKSGNSDRFARIVTSAVMNATIVFMLTGVYDSVTDDMELRIFIYALWGVFFWVGRYVKDMPATAEST